jgi:hypothetical protein
VVGVSDWNVSKLDLLAVLLWHGWADPAISPDGTIAYYHALTERTGGTDATQRFARLFMLPRVAHCGDGQGPDTIDALTLWVPRTLSVLVMRRVRIRAGCRRDDRVDELPGS